MKSKDKTYKSNALASVHETISDLYEIGGVDKRTMRKFDKLCLTEVTPLQPDEIKAIRQSENVSQAVFALYLNVSKGLVSEWERGEKRPAGASLKLLSLVRDRGLGAIA